MGTRTVIDQGASRITPLARQPRTTRVREARHALPALPVSLASIIGRDSLLAQVRSVMDTGGARLVTLTGPGGIGKTRLALEIASQLQAEYADGAALVSMEAEHDARQAPATIAHALGVHHAAGDDIADALAGALKRRHLLLVLDNLEQIAPAFAPWLADLLSRCPRLHILAASRVPLRIAGEHQFSVPPLPTPVPSPRLTAEEARRSPAVQLFGQRATETRASFAVDDVNAPTIAAICERLDGMPLAIELAAARVTIMSPATLLRRLDEQGEVLSGNRHDLPERHRTITRTIAWSYDLLTDDEQRLFRHLAVFAGGFSLGAVEAFVGAAPLVATPAVDVLQSLIHHSLVSHVDDAAGEVRFRLLEPVRRFALAQLEATGEEPRARDAHAAWGLALAARGWAGMKGPDQAAWIDRLEAEHANLRAANEWLLDADRIEDAIGLSLRLSLFRHLRGHTSDLARLYDRFLSHARVSDPSLARGRALLCRGSLAQTQYDPDTAIAMLREAAELLRIHDAHEDEAAARWLLGNVYRFMDDPAAAEPMFAACLDIGHATGDTRLIGVGLSHIGVAAAMQGQLDRAEATLREAKRVAEGAGDTWVLSMTWVHLAQVAMARGDSASAEDRLRAAEPLLRSLGDKVGLARLRVMIAELVGRSGDEATAEEYYGESLVDARTRIDKEYAARILLERSRRAASRGDRSTAATEIRESLHLYEDMAQPTGVARCMGLLASVAVEVATPAVAARLLGMADGLLGAATHDASALEHELACVRGQVIDALGDAAYAAQHAVGKGLARPAAIAEAARIALEISARSATTNQAAVATAGLTPRELEVVRLLADGLSNDEIAEALFVSPRTIAGHVANILIRLQLRSRTAIVAYAIRNGLA